MLFIQVIQVHLPCISTDFASGVHCTDSIAAILLTSGTSEITLDESAEKNCRSYCLPHVFLLRIF